MGVLLVILGPVTNNILRLCDPLLKTRPMIVLQLMVRSIQSLAFEGLSIFHCSNTDDLCRAKTETSINVHFEDLWSQNIGDFRQSM
jgi:hypothetical protein